MESILKYKHQVKVKPLLKLTLTFELLLITMREKILHLQELL